MFSADGALEVGNCPGTPLLLRVINDIITSIVVARFPFESTVVGEPPSARGLVR
jgi:hypothetical protein